MYKKYDIWLFDCDGVILDSNKVKTNAFWKTTEKYGADKADALVEYHIANGGISRHKKFEYFCKNILNLTSYDSVHSELLEIFAKHVRQGLMECNQAPDVRRLLSKLQDKKCYIVSGGLQQELVEIFTHRELYVYFDGIYGSPRSKSEILSEMDLTGNIVFVGDSKYDYDTAQDFGIDFIFLYGMSEFKDWHEHFKHTTVDILKDTSDILNKI